MTEVTLAEAQATLPALIAGLPAGGTVVITDVGRVVATLSVNPGATGRAAGSRGRPGYAHDSLRRRLALGRLCGVSLMRLLLDTHALLWFWLDDSQLSPAAKSAIQNPANDIAVSIASLWEVAIKVAAGKYTLRCSFPDFIQTAVTLPGFTLFGVSPSHVLDLLALPPHHKDPFDRMLVAQARVEGLTLVTCDDKIALYPVPQLW